MIFKVIFGSEIHIVKSTDKQKFHQLLAFLPAVFKSLPKRYKLSYLDQEGDEITFEDQNDYDVLLGTGLKSVKIIIRQNNEDFIEMTNEIQIDLAHQDIMEQEISVIKHNERKGSVNESMQEANDSLIEEKIKMLLPEIISKIKAQITEDLKEKSKASLKNQPIIIEQPCFKKQEKKEQANELPKKEVVIHRGITCDGCNWRDIEGIRYKCSVCADFDFCEKCEATVDHSHPFLKIKTIKQTPMKIFAVINEEDGPSLEVNGQHFEAPLDRLVHQGYDMVRGFIGRANCEQFKNKYNAAKEEWKKQSEEWKKSWNSPQKCEEKQQKKNEEKTEAKVEPKVQVKVQPKVEVKVEPKVEVKAEVKENKPKTVGYDVIKGNANYLVEVFGFTFEKCLKWAQMFPYMTKEELLSYCLSQPNFYN